MSVHALSWAPHPTTWRYVHGGDLVAETTDGEPNGTTRLVSTVDVKAGQLVATVLGAADWRWSGIVDPDQPVMVLRPVPEVDALTLTAAALGARLIDERSAA